MMEEIQQAISHGNLDMIREYYSTRSGMTGDGLHLDDAILLATVHKQPLIVDVLLKMKYERPEDVIANASVSFICRHPRIIWTREVMLDVLTRASPVTDSGHIAKAMMRFDATETAQIIVRCPLPWVNVMIDGYLARFGKDRKMIDQLVVISSTRKEVFIIAVRETLHVMSIKLLRSVSKRIGDDAMPLELFESVVGCRDYGKMSALILRVYAFVNRWDEGYKSIIRSR